MLLMQQAPLLTAKEVAHLAGVSVDTVKRALKAGLLRGTTIGRRGDWRITLADAQAWMNAGAPTPPKPKPKFKPAPQPETEPETPPQLPGMENGV